MAWEADILKVKGESESESDVTQFFLTLWDPTDCSLPGSSVHGIFQARILEWVAISFSRGSSRPRDRTRVSLHCRKTLYCLSYQGSPIIIFVLFLVGSWDFLYIKPCHSKKRYFNFFLSNMDAFISLSCLIILAEIIGTPSSPMQYWIEVARVDILILGEKHSDFYY